MLENLCKLISTYYEMNDGEHIKNFQNNFVVYRNEIEIFITNRTLKHIVEQRKKDKYTKDTIIQFFSDALNI